MAAAEATRKSFLLISLLAISLATATAADASIQSSNNLVWDNNPGEDTQLTYTCTDAEFRNLTVSGNVVQGLEANSSSVTSSQVVNTASGLGGHSVKLSCMDVNSSEVVTDSETFEIKKLQFEVDDDSRGFFGEKLVETEFKRPIGIKKLSVKDGDGSPENVENAEFSFSDNDDIGVETGSWDLTTGKINPSIGADFPPVQEEVRVKATYEDLSEPVTVSDEAGIEVYPYRPVDLTGNTGRKVSYDNLGDFQYTFNLEGMPSGVHQEHFRLDVVQVSGEDAGEVIYSDKQWFSESQPEGSRDYHLKLSNIPELTLGEKYRFETYIKKDIEGETRITPIDNIRVVKNLQFSGVVRDSSGGPVRTEMVLKRQNSENIPVNTGSDGTYSTTIDDRDFDSVNLKFFYRDRNTPDTEFQISDLTLGENPNLGFSSEAVRYQYWDNPVSNVKGLKEVNMMAGKFSHDIDGSAEAFMKFDPQSVNPEDLRVYECSSWNFQGRECMTSWDVKDENDVSINYATWQVHLQDLDLHEIPEDVTGGSNKTILMNAYIVGTSSQLDLAGDTPVSASSGRLAANSELTISGGVVNGEGDSVENANVTVKLVKDEEAFRTFETTSGPNGGFEVTGKAPGEDGRYKIEVTVSKEKFQVYSTESSKTVEVFYERGLSLSSSGSPSLSLGEKSSITFELSNTGQQEIQDVSVEVSGLENEYYSKAKVPGPLGAGETGDLSLTIDLPADFCPAPCSNPPIIDVKASGSSAGEGLEASTTIYTSINRDSSSGGQQTDNEETQEVAPQGPENSTNSSSSFTKSINNMTGNFLKRQSSVNVALGLILVFTLILAAAIRKKKTSGGDRRSGGRGRGRPVSGGEGRVSRPQVKPEEIEEPEESEQPEEVSEEEEADGREEESVEQDEDQEESEEEEESDESGEGLEMFYDEEKDAYVCEETGEEFDTKEGLKMHRKINNIDS